MMRKVNCEASGSCEEEVGGGVSGNFQQRIQYNMHPHTTIRKGIKLTFFKRCLVILFLQIGCFALDHSTRELSYEEDDLGLIIGHQFSSDSLKLIEDNPNDERQHVVSFHPKFLDFKESPVGMPRIGLVRVDNGLKDENIKLISISAHTVHFHSSFFADKVIIPGGNTTFEIVFLSRTEGLVVSNLYIHTNKGLFKYQVRGIGLANPYRLKPLIGAIIPVGFAGSYEPLITMHNPHDTPIQVVEMLSSGTDFHLKLPDQKEASGESAAWAIEPFQTKPVMKGSFQGKAEGNHTGFIKIRVNSTRITSEYLLVPVEVQVSSKPGIYLKNQDSLDFGLMVMSDKPKTLSLSLINNAQSSSVNIQSVSVKGGNSAVRIEFRPLLIEPESTAIVALVTFYPSEAKDPKLTAGFIEIKSQCGKYSLNVPFRANILQGELEYNASTLGYFAKAVDTSPRNFSVQNGFASPVAIYQVNSSHPRLIRIENFNISSNVIQPGEQKTIFTFKLNKKSDFCDLDMEVYLTLKSNITDIKLPIKCYDGKLHLYTLENGELHFGRVEMFSTHMEYFAVDNKNPVEIRLKSWGSNSTWAQVELVGMQKGSKEDLAKIKDFDSLKKSLFLQAGYMAVFSLELRRPSIEGVFFGESYVTTDHNQTLRVPFRFSVSRGSIHSEKVIFDKAFPGKISYEKFYLSSTFNHTVNLLSLRSDPPSLIWFNPSSGKDSIDILPHRKNYMGKIHLDLRKFCGSEHCFTGFCKESLIGSKWIRGVSIDSEEERGQIDWEILNALKNRYAPVKELTVSNVSIWLETSEMNDFKISTQISYIWPSLTSGKSYSFPLTGLGNESYLDISVTNPSSAPILVQALLASEYGYLWSQQFVQNLPDSIGNLTEGNLVFSLHGILTSSQTNNSGNPIFAQVQKQVIEEILNVTNTPGITFFLPPGAKFILRAKFQPQSKEMASTLVLLRNNLTGIETFWIKGRAGIGSITVGNGNPGSSLLFQLTEKLLQGCQNEGTSKYVSPQLTVRRSFIARNVGEIPLDIRRLEIYPPQTGFWVSSRDSIACEGYGFRILNCHPFSLQPNQTHSIDIAFTPDFTMTRVVRSIQLVDSSGLHFNYSLVAMIPNGMLSLCSSIITRPFWEPYLKYFLIVLIVIGIVAASLMAYFDAGSIVSNAVVSTYRVLPADSRESLRNDGRDSSTKLDLKAVYDKVDNRFKRNNALSALTASTLASSTSSCLKTSPVSSSNSPLILNNQKSIPNSSSSTSAADSFTENNIMMRNRKKNKSNSGSSGGGGTSESNFMTSNKLDDQSNSSSSSLNITTNKSQNSFLSHIDALFSKNTMPDESLLSLSNSNSNNNNNNNNNKLTKEKDDKKSRKNKKQNNLGKSQKGGGSNGKKQNIQAQQEEETSSTTTESSNPDDFSLPGEKERQNSGKSTGSNENFLPKISNEKITNNNNNNKVSKFSNSDSKTMNKENNFISASTNDDSKDEFDMIISGGKKKYNAKKRNSTDSTFLNTTKGNISPKDSMAALWDTPRNSIDGGLTEIAAQTEAFLMGRPTPATTAAAAAAANQFSKRAYSDQIMNQAPTTNVGNPMQMHNIMGNSAQFAFQPPSSIQQHTAVNGYGSVGVGGGAIPVSSSGRSSKRASAGVIGQQRSHSTSQSRESPMNHQSSQILNLTSVALTLSTIAPPVNSSSSSSSSKNSRISSGGSNNGGGNGNGNGVIRNTSWDILPDNGCDIWNRRFQSQSNSSESIGTSNSFTNLASTSTSASSSSPYRPISRNSLTENFSQHPHFHQSTPTSPASFSVTNNSTSISTSAANTTSRLASLQSGKNSSGGGAVPTSSSHQIENSILFNNGITNELLNNLWQLNNTYESHQPQSTSSTYQQQQQQQQFTSTPTTASQQLPYLQRRQRGFSGSTNWSNPPYSYGEGNSSADNWPPQITSTTDSIYGGWGSSISGNNSPNNPIGHRPPSTPIESSSSNDIWESSTSSKWSTPVNYGVGSQSSGTAGNYSDSSMVGGGGGTARLTSNSPGLPGEVIRNRADFVNQREIEAGLGFNPFTSNIWNQTSDAPAWGNAGNANANTSYRTSSSKNE